MKKAPIAVALVLVFGLFAAAFSLAPAVAQYTPPSDSTATSSTNSTSTNATSSSNTTTSTTTNATGGETFSASGSIAALIFDMGETTTTSEVSEDTTLQNDTSMSGNMTASGNATTSSNTTMMPQVMTGDNATSSGNLTDTGNMTSSSNDTSTSTTSNETSTAAEELELPYIASGDWTLDVQDGNVSDFSASFTMVHTDGTGRHTHDMSNFASSNSSTIDTSGDGTSFIFGTVDVATDGEARWTGADALIVIEKNNVVSISLATEDTEDHFGGQPIYGIVESMTDENGNEMIESGATETAGNVTEGAENAVNETGEFLGNITEGVQDFFNGTGQ